MKIRRKKKQVDPAKLHPQYNAGLDATWMDNERERNGKSVKRNFWYIIGLSAIIAIVLIIAAVVAGISATTTTTTITAADTFAVSAQEQQTMVDRSKLFAGAMLKAGYCSDKQTSLDAKNIALACMAQGTSSYTAIENLSIGNGTISDANFKTVLTDPTMTAGTQTYAGDYVYKFSGCAFDSASGKAADAGYDFTLTFSKANDVNDAATSDWVISACDISRAG